MLGKKIIGKDVFIIAEAGVNHNGKLDIAIELVDAAKKAGADAVKFQIFNAKRLTASRHDAYKLKPLELSHKDFITLKKYCNKQGIMFLCTPHSGKKDVDFLESLKVPAYKIGSGDLTNLPLLKYIASKKKPIILSTGMATLAEVKEAINTIKVSNDKIVVLQCTTSYPCKDKDVNLRAMRTIRDSYNVLVGYSDHTLGATASISATAMGACVIEKHLTLCKYMNGPDHKASSTPEELTEMVKEVRRVVYMQGKKKPTATENKIKERLRKSIYARCDIKKGSTITKAMLSIKRPNIGIAPKLVDKIIGTKAKKNIIEGQAIKWDMLR